MKRSQVFRSIALLAIGTATMLTAEAANVTVNVTKSDGTPLSGVTAVAKKGGTNYNMGTTQSNGIISKSLADGYYHITFTYAGTTFQTEETMFQGDINMDIATTSVTFHALGTVDNQGIGGVSVSYAPGGSFSAFGSTDISGNVSKEMFPGTYNFRGIKMGTVNYQSATVTGNPYYQGNSSDVYSYLTKITVSALGGSAGVPISGVTVKFNGSTNFGTTDGSGTKVGYLYPGIYDFNYYKAGTTNIASHTITGDGTDPNAFTNITTQLTLVSFANSGTTQYFIGGSLFNLSGNFYMYPGNYKFRFRSQYDKFITVSGLDFQKAAAIIILKDHTGALQSIDHIRGGYGTSVGWHVTDGATENGDGISIDISPNNTNTSRIYEVRKNNSLTTLSQDLMANNVFNFQTGLLSLKLQTCSNNTPISGGSIRYGFGSTINLHWGSVTDANGMASKELFNGNYIIEMKLNNTISTRNIVFTGNTQEETWTSTNVKFNYPGRIMYLGAQGTNGWFKISPSSAPAEMEMFAGPINFNFRSGINNADFNMLTIDIPSADDVCNFTKTVVIGRLVNSSNQPLVGTFTPYQAGWKAGITTASNGNAVALYDGTVTTATSAMTYEGSKNQQNNVNLASVDNVISYQTMITTMQLLDADGGSSLDADNISYYAGNAWRTFGLGTTTFGTETMELLSGSYSFAAKLNGSRVQQSNVDISTNPTITFQAAKVVLSYKDGSDAPISGASASQYNGNGWFGLGNTDVNGLAYGQDVLLGSLNTYKVASIQKSNQTINSIHDTIQFGGMAPIGLKLQLNSSNEIAIYPNPASDKINVTYPGQAATIEIYSIDGRKVSSQKSENGSATINVSELNSEIYTVNILFDNKIETLKFLKK